MHAPCLKVNWLILALAYDMAVPEDVRSKYSPFAFCKNDLH